jgi:hypothetical protein
MPAVLPSQFVLPMIFLPPSPLLLDPTFLMLSLLPLTVSSLSLADLRALFDPVGV